MRKIYIIIGSFFAFFFILFVYFNLLSGKVSKNVTLPQGQPEFVAPENEVISVEVDKVVRGEIARIVTTTGSLMASQSVDLVPDQEGRITNILFNQGERVQEGQILLEMDSQRHVIRVEKSQAQLKQALSNYERGKKLFKQKSISTAQLDELLRIFQVTQAELKDSILELDRTKLKAPFSGLVGLKKVSVGSFVGRNQEILALVNNDILYVDFDIPQSYTAWVKVGMGIDVFVDGMGDLPFLGRVVAIDARANPDTHSISVRGQIDNPDNTLRPGQYARVVLELGKEHHALLMPWAAVKQRGTRTSVFRVLDDGRAMETPVLLGQKSGSRVHVIEGLREGDHVVSGGHMRLVSGMSVKVLTEETTAD